MLRAGNVGYHPTFPAEEDFFPACTVRHLRHVIPRTQQTYIVVLKHGNQTRIFGRHSKSFWVARLILSHYVDLCHNFIQMGRPGLSSGNADFTCSGINQPKAKDEGFCIKSDDLLLAFDSFCFNSDLLTIFIDKAAFKDIQKLSVKWRFRCTSKCELTLKTWEVSSLSYTGRFSK